MTYDPRDLPWILHDPFGGEREIPVGDLRIEPPRVRYVCSGEEVPAELGTFEPSPWRGLTICAALVLLGYVLGRRRGC